MGNRVSNGAVSRPLRVVAPIKVNRGRLSCTLRALVLVDDDIQLVTHRGVEIFLHGLLHAMDFINEQYIAFLEISE